MRIIEVNIPKSEDSNSDGLEPIKMTRLGQVVLLAGKNGSGKTRVLNKLSSVFNKKPTASQVQFAVQQSGIIQREIDAQTERFDKRKLELGTKTNQIESLHNLIRTHEKEKQKHIEQINWDEVITNVESNHYQAFHFVPKSLVLKDHNEFRKIEIRQKAKIVDQVGINGLPDGTIAKIQMTQDAWFNATHPNLIITKEEKKQAIQEYMELSKLLQHFLKDEIKRDVNGDATIFGFPIGQARLSDGQKVLIQFCVALFSQSKSLSDLVLFMDEPENHLHPSVIIETLDRIIECIPNGQVWIATHSIPILAHFDSAQIWFVENNQVSYAGHLPEKVLHSLLGDDEEIGKLQDFIGLPAQLASARYAFECLFDPKVVETKFTDPQSVQIHSELSALSKTDKVRVLDFGAGKGRVISNLAELDESAKERVLGQLDYVAFDPSDKDKTQCENSIAKTYGSAEKRYYNSVNEILGDYDKNSFQVIIMCNVLHEIDPNKWFELFGTDGSVTKLLAKNGTLLLVEDHQIPVGEKAYQKGFLVLDTPQLKDLFKITEADGGIEVSDVRGDGRLKAHRIPSNCLGRIDANSRIEALQSISSLTKSKITEIRTQDQNYKNGKLHGYYVQQFANAQLCLSELTT
ncbi:MAG: AAA family ATPase [Flavobacteriales bacterium]|nr:AAA family ATPase [Flavobacteriales bacterium]